MLLGRHEHNIVHRALEQATCVRALTVFEPQDVSVVIFVEQYLFANDPTESQHLSEPADLRVSKLQFAVEDEVNLGFGRLVLFVNALARFDHQYAPVFKQVLESVESKQVEDGVLQPNFSDDELGPVVAAVDQVIKLADIGPHLLVQGLGDLRVVALLGFVMHAVEVVLRLHIEVLLAFPKIDVGLRAVDLCVELGVRSRVV